MASKRILFTSLTIFLHLSFLGFAQEKTTKDTLRGKLINAAKEIMADAKTCALVTLDNEGRPRVRAMDPFPPDKDLTVWFGTNSNSRKVTQVKNDNRVTLYYLDKDATGYVMIHGIAHIVDDKNSKERYWKTAWKDFYPNYPHDYTLIKVIPQWMEVISETRGILGDTKTWEPSTVKFKTKQL